MGGEKYAYLIIFVLFKTSLLDKNQHFFSFFLQIEHFDTLSFCFSNKKTKLFHTRAYSIYFVLALVSA